MVVQFHWQNPAKPSETIFVAQDEVNSNEDMWTFIERMKDRKSECPKDWMPMICNSDCEHFVTMNSDGQLLMTADQIAVASR